MKKFVPPSAEEGWGILSTGAAAAKVGPAAAQSTGAAADAKKAAGGFALGTLIGKGSKFGGLDVKRVYFGFVHSVYLALDANSRVFQELAERL